MNLDALLAQARAAHEALMSAASDRVRVQRPSAGTFDQSTGQDTPGTPLVLYEGPARVKPVSLAADSEAQAGEREIRLRNYEIAVPWSTSLPPGQVLRPGDEVHVLASADPRLPGSVLWVTGGQYSATATAWRIYAEDREAGTG